MGPPDAIGSTASHRTLVAGALLALALLLGGGQGGLGDMLVQLLALVAAFGLFASGELSWRALLSWRRPEALVWLFLLIPLVQMLPLPIAWWTADPARAALAAQLASVGQSPSPHVGLVPLSAERAAWGLLPGIAIYLLSLGLPADRRRILCTLLLLAALASIVLGIAQVAAGPDSPLRFYQNTNRTDTVGFFANRNHLAALLLASLPLAVARLVATIAAPAPGHSPHWARVAAWAASIVLVLLGLALTRSRSGLLLGMVAVLACAPMLVSIRSRRAAGRVLVGMGAVACLLLAQFAMFGVAQRMRADPLGDERWSIAATTVHAAHDYAPLGSGLGTFRPVFQAYDVQAPGMAIVNHAHDDYLELWLEAGWPFGLVLAVFAAVVGRAAWRAWRGGGLAADPWPVAASVSLALLLLHSALDYPLRTTALQACFGLLLAVLLARDAAPPPRAS